MIRSADLPQERLIAKDGYVDGQEEWLAFQAADWIWLAYEGFYGPSGVLAQARQVGKPVIHRGEGLIGYFLPIRNNDILLPSKYIVSKFQ